MMKKRVMPPGTWESRLSASMVSQATTRFSFVSCQGEDIYWLEGRPWEKGRTVLVRYRHGVRSDLTPEPFSVRSRVNEYGGLSYVVAGERLIFVNDQDQSLYILNLKEGSIVGVLAKREGQRFADLHYDVRRNRLLAVSEQHRLGQSVRHSLVYWDLNSNCLPIEMVSGHDFYAYPRLSPDGRKLAWMAWNHPVMPWESSELFVAEFSCDGQLHQVRPIAGGVQQAVLQPEWSPDGELYFSADGSGWWNIYRWNGSEIHLISKPQVSQRPAEYGQPLWLLGMSNYGFLDSQHLFVSVRELGQCFVAILDVVSGSQVRLPADYSSVDYVCCFNQQVMFVAATPLLAAHIVHYHALEKKTHILATSQMLEFNEADISQGEHRVFLSDGSEVYGFYYPPCHREYTLGRDVLPPLIVFCHGGPTACATHQLNLLIQFWTNRGFAVWDVNYSGSVGYGRQYRERLRENWGIVDVRDCINGVDALIQKKTVDQHRIAIRGGSAGGFTALNVLCDSTLFAAGCCLYGIGDLITLMEQTHKFERGYVQGLIGAYPSHAQRYWDRSPLHKIHQIKVPVLFIHGTEDAVVPITQAQQMAAALREKQQPVAFVPLTGEQHGFRSAVSIQQALEAELSFYTQVFKLNRDTSISHLKIENFNERRSG